MREVPLALYTPALERATTDAYYRGKREYLRGPHVDRGLFPYEEETLARYFPLPPARLLLHGAGSGRELAVLLERGYDVDGFEPVAEAVDEANRRLAARPNTRLARVERATLQEWGAGTSGATYDGVVTGWAMWTHILAYADRIEALRRLRAACPDGPLLLSFFRAEPDIDETEWGLHRRPLHPAPAGWRRIPHGLLRKRLLHLPPLERGTEWEGGTYVHLVDEPELEEEAALTGWQVAHYERDATRYGHAVLLPHR